MRFKVFIFVLLVIATILEYYLIAKAIFPKKTKEIQKIANVVKQNILGTRKLPLSEVVEQALSDSQGTYAIFIKNLKTGQEYKTKEHEKFETGSLYKLWVMATAFDLIERGSLKETDLLSQDIQTLNEKFWISTESAELAEGHIEMTVSEALNQMITISHNYAALLLSERVRNFRIRDFLKNNNFEESHLSTASDPPKATASDIAFFLQRIYKNELVSKVSSQKMIELLKRQELNDGLPKYLPTDVVVAHKTGELGWFKHDAGIVFPPPSGGGDYIIVVLSKSNYPLGAQERIAKISEAVYSYFESPN